MLQGYAGDSLARMCVSKLAAFIQDADQNRMSSRRDKNEKSKLQLIVKYIALLAMVKIVPSHPHLVAEYQDTILASVNDQDISIRMRALDLVSAMVRTHCFNTTRTRLMKVSSRSTGIIFNRLCNKSFPTLSQTHHHPPSPQPPNP